MQLYVVVLTDKTEDEKYTHVFSSARAALDHVKAFKKAIPEACKDDWDIFTDFGELNDDEFFLDWVKDYYSDYE